MTCIAAFFLILTIPLTLISMHVTYIIYHLDKIKGKFSTTYLWLIQSLGFLVLDFGLIYLIS